MPLLFSFLRKPESFRLKIPGKLICREKTGCQLLQEPPIGLGKVGEVDLFAILKSSFRQTPDYLIVGEVRGKEAFVLFQGIASGHSALSTMHADSVDTLIRRLQTPPINLSPTLV